MSAALFVVHHRTVDLVAIAKPGAATLGQNEVADELGTALIKWLTA